MPASPYNQPIKDWPEDERPRERLLQFGEASLSEAQLLAIILRTGDPASKASAVDVALGLLDLFNNDLSAMSNASVTELSQASGIGPAKACEIKAAFELGRRRMEREDGPLQRRQFRCSEDVANFYMPRFADKKREQFQVLMLDRKNRFMRDVMVSQGSLDTSVVHPREVFNTAIRDSAAAIICVHNHPSGDPQPSPEDRALTRRLLDAGETLGIPVLDHIIVGRNCYVSFKDEGWLANGRG
jgi:DNA repair protein RadC